MRVTIGLSFYNCERVLVDAIRSVYAQTYDDWELVLINDGSSDRSLAIARAISDPRVRLVDDGINRGLSSRLNQITRLSRGEYVARMDADDLMHPTRLMQQVQFLDANLTVDAVDTALCSIDEANRPLGIRGRTPLDTRPEAVLGKGLLNHATVLGRVDWFRAHPYDEGLLRSQDRELWCRTFRSVHFDRIQEPLYFVREYGSDTVKKYLASQLAVRKIYHRYGRKMVGRHRLALLILESHLKNLAYWMYNVIGKEGVLIRSRNSFLTEAENVAAQGAIETILNTPIPGYDRNTPLW